MENKNKYKYIASEILLRLWIIGFIFSIGFLIKSGVAPQNSAGILKQLLWTLTDFILWPFVLGYYWR
jgi:hypothetical protein